MTATRGPRDAGADGSILADGECSVFRVVTRTHDEGLHVAGVGDSPNSGDCGVHDGGS